MDNVERRIPPGPSEKYDISKDLLLWMGDQVRQFGDIFKASVYGTDVYVVNDPQYLQHILRNNWRNYSKNTMAMKRIRMLLGNGIITSEGDFWKRQRRKIQPTFHYNVIAGLTKTIVNANTALLENWERAAQRHETVNVTRDINLMVLETVLVFIFGEDYPHIAPQFNVLAEESARDLEFVETFRPLRKVVAGVAAQRRAENRTGNDFLGMLMDARDRDNGKVMADGQLITEVITLVVAGYETTSLMLNWTWYFLSQNGDVDAKLMDELRGLSGSELPNPSQMSGLTYTNQVLNEALRLYPPVWLIVRKTVHDDFLAGYFVPAKSEIYFSPYLIQRHPDIWEAPDRFDPDHFAPDRAKDRHELAMLPFGAGPRNCVGEALARYEMQIHLIMIARRLRLRYENARPLDLETGVNLRPRQDFIMTPELRTL
jgi:cytochrome P450